LIFKKKKNINFLNLTPVHNKKYTETNGRVKIRYPKFRAKVLQSLIPKTKPKDIVINLDELGTEVWISNDGYKKVSTIISELSGRLGDRIHPAEERITKFLTMLYTHEFIRFKEFNK